MLEVNVLRSRGGAVFGVLALGASALGPQPARAQTRPFPVTRAPLTAAPRGGSAGRRASYGALPLSFEQNNGQAPAAVRYLAHGQGYSLALTSTEARLALQRPEQNSARGRGDGLLSQSRTAPGSHASQSVVRMQLVGADSRVAARASSPLPGKVNYILGSDATKWHTDIATYGKVQYSGVYPGVDLVYYGNQKQLEYDFVVAPGANPSRIALRFAGAKKLSVDPSGNLMVKLDGGAVRWQKPAVYQQVDGKRTPIAGRFVLKGVDQVRFAIARYDKRRPLVIDPVLIYSTYLGGGGNDQAYGVAIDSVGSAYITGRTTSQNFPGTVGGFTGNSEGFISKLNASGTGLVYSTYIGGSGDTNCWGIAVDGAGNAYVAGDTTSTNFPLVRGFSITNAGNGDAFLARLNSAGSALVYSTLLGGADVDTAQGIALGPNGNAYVIGYTFSTDFPTVAALQPANGGGADVFVAIVNTAASGVPSLVYSTYLGGTGDDRAFGVAVDNASKIYITGDTGSADFPVVSGYQGAILSSQNAFVSVFASNGSSLAYSTFLGGSGSDNSGFAIAVDKSGNAFVTGQTNSPDFPKRNAIQTIIGGSDDAFVTKFSPAVAGDASLVYSTYLGGSGNDAGRSIAVDVWGNAYVTGDTDSTFTPFTGSKGFVTKLSVDGTKILFGTLIGGSTFESDLGIAIDTAGTAYVVGYTTSTDFPITPGSLQGNLAGDVNTFIFKMPTFTNLDFNHDNQSDLVFQNSADGRLVYWTMNGDRETRFGFLSPQTPGAGWNLVASADLNGDNTTDLIFQNSSSGDIVYWLMNGTQETSFAFLNPRNPGAGWKVAGTGDFNRDGFTDVLLQNSQTGDLYVWNMNGATMVSGGFLTPQNPGSGWKAVAVGDLNGDGQPDILFQNSTSGNLYVWYMHGSTMFAGGFLNPANPGAGWNVAGLADLNGDGQPEILFQNSGSGQLAYWVMSGSNLVFSGLPRPSNPGGAVWKLVGPH